MKNYSLFGGCQCGALRYSFNGPLGTTDVCHCRMCQKAFGSFGAVLLRVPLAQFAWARGIPSIFKSSEHVDRGFCQKCGTPMYMYEDGDEFIDVAVGTLDNPNLVGKLESQIGIESRLHWFDTMHKLPEQLTSETRQPEEMTKLKSFQHPDHDTEIWPPKSV